MSEAAPELDYADGCIGDHDPTRNTVCALRLKPVQRVPEASGYDWLLNKCSDGDQAEHAAHLDEGQDDPRCFHCRGGEGR